MKLGQGLTGLRLLLPGLDRATGTRSTESPSQGLSGSDRCKPSFASRFDASGHPSHEIPADLWHRSD